jgi:hypothetical protein
MDQRKLLLNGLIHTLTMTPINARKAKNERLPLTQYPVQASFDESIVAPILHVPVGSI